MTEAPKTDSTAERLKSYISRIERLLDERQGISEDIKAVFMESKGSGFDVKIMRQVIKLRKLDANDRQEQEALLETYLAAMEILPLERAAERRVG